MTDFIQGDLNKCPVCRQPMIELDETITNKDADFDGMDESQKFACVGGIECAVKPFTDGYIGVKQEENIETTD